MTERKYVVIKKSELEKLEGRSLHFGVFEKIRSLDLEDAEVIRGQDLTAASIFYHYASSMQAMAELIEHMRLPMVPEYVKKLRDIADYFFDAAHRSEQRTDRKLPD
jgi:hypothetical protein